MHECCDKSYIQLNTKDERAVSGLFKLLGEPSRLKIVCALMGTQMCVQHLAEEIGMEQSALSHQLRNLRNAGLVKSEKDGKQVMYSLDDAHVYDIIRLAIEHIRHQRKETEDE